MSLILALLLALNSCQVSETRTHNLTITVDVQPQSKPQSKPQPVIIVPKSEFKFKDTVYRVSVATTRESSLGSGVAVATINNQTLILTAWHVVKDGGLCKVGDYQATVIDSNKTWDLAAIVVNKKLTVSPLSNRKPELNDFMTVCGYGGLNAPYKEIRGQAVHFFSPARGDNTTDIVAIDKFSRSGDSGGPLFYDDGTVGAILFGTDVLGSHGSHCLRVRWFLKQIKGYDELITEALEKDYGIY